MSTHDLVFLFDIDNTLVDNDHVQADLKQHLATTYGAEARDRYWEILEQKRAELEDVERLYPARHYVLIDDKLRILTAAKKTWGNRVTTVFPQQGHYALDPALHTQ